MEGLLGSVIVETFHRSLFRIVVETPWQVTGVGLCPVQTTKAGQMRLNKSGFGGMERAREKTGVHECVDVYETDSSTK